MIVMQVANVFMCRSDDKSAFSFSLSSNPLIWWGIATEVLIILLIVYTPWGNRLFGTSPIPWDAWRFMFPFAIGMVVVEKSRK